MDKILSLSFRPQKLSELVGLPKLANAIRGHHKSKRMPPAWMFSGETGCGKTTIARILAMSLQCDHDDFGEPCQKCHSRRSQFDIMEINASEIKGVQDIGQLATSSTYAPRPPSKARVYILDECQQISTAAQNLLLKYFEDCPKTTFWIICTTDPHKMLRTLRNRCVVYRLAGLSPDGVSQLVQTAVTATGGNDERNIDALTEVLLENGIFSPRLVLIAVEKYLAGASPVEAVKSEIDAGADTLKLCRALVQGDWNKVQKQLKNMSAEDTRSLIYQICGYLKPMVIQPRVTKSASDAASAILKLTQLQYLDESLRNPALAATLYELSQKFGHLKR